MIGRLRTVVFDTREPQRLATFYAGLLGGEVVVEREDWVALKNDAGWLLSFQTAPAHAPPRFPDEAGAQQLHLDVVVDDVDDAERKVLELGATRVPDANEDHRFRVYRDPAGHPFCLVWD